MVFGYLLLVFIPLAAVAYVIWDHQRKAAQRLAASADRLQSLLGTSAPVAPQSAPTSAAQGSAAGASTRPVVSASDTAAASVTPLYATRERLLSPPQALVYHMLRIGLPDHLVFARMTLASVLDAGLGVSAYARAEHVRRLAAIALDFVVSDRRMSPVAVVMLKLPGSSSSGLAEGANLMPAWLATAGVRYVEFDAAALPRKDAMREVVLGPAAAPESAQAPSSVAG